MQATHHRLAALALAGFSMLVAADDDVDGSFEDGSGSGEPGSGEPGSGAYPSPPGAPPAPTAPPPIGPADVAPTGLTTGAIAGIAVGAVVGVVALAVLIFWCAAQFCAILRNSAQFGAIPTQLSDAPPNLHSCMRASQSKQATGSLATGNTTIKRNNPQAGPVTDQGQELVVRGGPSAKI